MEDERKIRKKLILCIPLIAIAISIPFISLYWDYRPLEEPVGSWFQRSGSFVVFLAVLVEYMLFSINGDVNPSGVIIREHGNTTKRFGLWHNLLTIIALILAIVGTLIWGYGDLLYTHIFVE